MFTMGIILLFFQSSSIQLLTIGTCVKGSFLAVFMLFDNYVSEFLNCVSEYCM